MKGSVKANLIVFLIIAVIAFCISSAFASLTIHEDNDSYKLIHIENDSFEPEEIDYVPTVIPKNDTNTTNSTLTNITNDIDDTINNWTESIDNIITYEDG
ncbi:hypothetical protein [Methanobrevibacter sp.]|uniref:hypothetical protein n=1 Tax=Methanobrevibacter sp. TaxID=66852 RepID=UPI0025CD31BC|nr:hypothetical protein [Methanobrevibacter sp.]MBQ2665471.1 hypothetical protein [Methanobrevibacter sp.]